MHYLSNIKLLKMSQKTEFIRIRNTLYNLRYVKEISCDDNMCKLTMANTQNGYAGYVKASAEFEDQVYECHRGRSPDCYEKLVKFVNEH